MSGEGVPIIYEVARSIYKYIANAINYKIDSLSVWIVSPYDDRLEGWRVDRLVDW